MYYTQYPYDIKYYTDSDRCSVYRRWVYVTVFADASVPRDDFFTIVIGTNQSVLVVKVRLGYDRPEAMFFFFLRY